MIRRRGRVWLLTCRRTPRDGAVRMLMAVYLGPCATHQTRAWSLFRHRAWIDEYHDVLRHWLP